MAQDNPYRERCCAPGRWVGTILVLFAGTIAGSTQPVAVGAEENSHRPPNILLIMADDVGREVLGCYGGTSYATPHLDRLATNGMRFTHCYSMPVCHPTRICLMTGRYPFRFRAGWGRFPKEATTFAHVLREAGYATAVAGKWQLVLQKTNPDHPQELGFDQSCLFGWHEGPRYHQPYIWQNGQRRTDVEKPDVFGPDVYCDFLIDFMTRHREQPFLAYYPMALCHEISDDFQPVPPPAPNGKYQDFREMAETMDAIVGRLVAALDRLALREQTVILFTTDNGSPARYLTHVEQRSGRIVRHHAPVVSLMHGREIRGGKGSLTDAGTRVPLIANWPGTIQPKQEVDDLIDFSDMLPTLAELAGARVPEGLDLDGHSFAGRLKGKGPGPREWVFCEHKNQKWVRTRDWKLYGDGRLFDMRDAAGQERPLTEDQQSAEAKAARKRLEQALGSLR
jgi:arylsulfatase A